MSNILCNKCILNNKIIRVFILFYDQLQLTFKVKTKNINQRRWTKLNFKNVIVLNITKICIYIRFLKVSMKVYKIVIQHLKDISLRFLYHQGTNSWLLTRRTCNTSWLVHKSLHQIFFCHQETTILLFSPENLQCSYVIEQFEWVQ